MENLYPPNVSAKNVGFTLAELLVALAVLGVIAAMTIPKVLVATGSARNTATAKEIAAMLSGSYNAFRQSSTPGASTGPGNLTPYWNYVRRDVSTTAGAFNTPITGSNWSQNCAAATPCYILASGAVVQFNATNNFAGMGATNAITFNLDPDGIQMEAGAVSFVLYYSGRITTKEIADAEGGITTTNSIVTIDTDPEWITHWN